MKARGVPLGYVEGLNDARTPLADFINSLLVDFACPRLYHTQAQPALFMTLLLQSPIRCCDKPAAGGLAPQTFDVLHEYASGPPGSARRSHDAAWRFRHEPS